MTNEQLETYFLAITQEIQSFHASFNERMSGLETKVDGLEIKIGGLETKVDNLETQMNLRFDRLGRQMHRLASDVLEVRAESSYLEDRIVKLEEAA